MDCGTPHRDVAAIETMLTKTIWLKTIIMIEIAAALFTVFIIGFLCGIGCSAMISVFRDGSALKEEHSSGGRSRTTQ